MRSLVSNIVTDDHVVVCRRRRLLGQDLPQYVARNALLPQLSRR